jgi:hypothetical protein
MICLPCTRAIFVDMPPPIWNHRSTQINTDEGVES